VRRLLAQRPPYVVGVALALAAAVILLLRLPGAFAQFDHAAKAASGRNELGGALATADSVGIGDDFVRDAFAYVPRNANFVLVMPAEAAAVRNGVNPTTLAAMPTFFENYLLPRREIPQAVPGSYMLCFQCRSPYWDRRVHWIASDGSSDLIGRVDR
jgi:hypothetical protein